MDEQNNIGKRIYFVKDTTKSSAGFREIFLTSETIKVLKKIRRISFKSGTYDKEGFIFVNDKGRIKSSSIQSAISRICKNLGIKHRSVHNIRKTRLSAMMDHLEMSWDEVRRIAGHASVKTLTDSYYFDRTEEKENEKMLEALDSMLLAK